MFKIFTFLLSILVAASCFGQKDSTAKKYDSLVEQKDSLTDYDSTKRCGCETSYDSVEDTYLEARLMVPNFKKSATFMGRLNKLDAYLQILGAGYTSTAGFREGGRGVSIHLDLDDTKIRSLASLIRLPKIFNDSLHFDKYGRYCDIAGKIGEFFSSNIMKDDDHYDFIVCFIRAKQKEKIFCAVVDRGGYINNADFMKNDRTHLTWEPKHIKHLQF